jgi:hypothetical protein
VDVIDVVVPIKHQDKWENDGEMESDISKTEQGDPVPKDERMKKKTARRWRHQRGKHRY